MSRMCYLLLVNILVLIGILSKDYMVLTIIGDIYKLQIL